MPRQLPRHGPLAKHFRIGRRLSSRSITVKSIEVSSQYSKDRILFKAPAVAARSGRSSGVCSVVFRKRLLRRRANVVVLSARDLHGRHGDLDPVLVE